ncbi:MAG: MoaD/ThiS family protein [Anaerolineae bacterium]|nr:MoaD/ThiS family protein [Anaerolineae bacterium]
MNIKVTLYYHLKEKAGTGSLDIALPDRSTIRDLKIILESQHPALKTHMDNVMMVMDKKIVLDEDFLKDNAEVAFLTPVGGG